MKCYNLEKVEKLQYIETPSKNAGEKKVVVRITSAALTSADIAMFKGIRKVDFPIVLSSLAVGVVSEVGEEVYSCAKGDRVILMPYFECGRCLECKTGESEKCQSVMCCGVTRNGYLCDFVEVPESKVVVIPKRLNEEVAIFARIVDIALHICDKLDVEKGENVIIGSAGMLGIIVAQVVEYYQGVPILIDRNIKNIEMSENFGFTQVYSLQKEDIMQTVMQATGGKMADSLILMSEHSFESEKAPEFVKKSGKIAVYRENVGSSSIDIDAIFERNITIYPVKSRGKEFMMAVNLLINQSVKVDGLYRKMGTFSEVDKTVEKLSEMFDNKESIFVNIVDMLG